MTAQEIFEEKGFKVSDNRNTDWRNINKAINFGIGVHPVKAGCYRTNKNGFIYRLKLTFGSITTYYQATNLRHYTATDIVSSCVINVILDFRDTLLKKGLLDEIIELAKEKEMPKCKKCNGKGIIPAFMHVSKGVCFDCLGLGYGKQGIRNK